MSWLSEGIDAAAEWFSKNPELDRKVAFNQMVHRGYDRIRNNLNSITPNGYETMINRGNMPSVSDVKKSLLGGENKQDGRIFADWQKETLNDNVARGWSPEDIEKYRQENDGRAPGPNEYSPGDVEYQKRLRGNELAEALLGPKTITSHFVNASPTTGMGTSHDIQVDPRDVAFERFQEDPEVRSAFVKGPDGSYVNGETMNNVMDNQYNPVGSFLVATGRAGEQSVANYMTHRDDGSGKGMSFLKGLGEMLYDTAAESPQWFGFKGFEQSENGKKIENMQRAAEMSERASPLVGSHDSLEARNADAENMMKQKEKTEYLNHAISYKNAHGKNPHWLESAAMNTIPMFADLAGAVAPLTAVSKAGWRGVPKAMAKAAAKEAVLEDLPPMTAMGVGSQALEDPLEMNQEQVKQVIDDRKKTHQEFSKKTGKTIKERLDNVKRGEYR